MAINADLTSAIVTSEEEIEAGDSQIFSSARPLLVLAIVVLFIVLVAAAFPSLISHEDPMALNPSQVLQPPSPQHPLGTDEYGREVLGELIYGSRDALLIGVLSVVGGGIAGSVIGLLSGYLGGMLDTLLMRLIDVLMVFPGILLALIISAALGPSLQNEIIAVAAGSIPAYARVMRGQVLSIRSRLYIDAAISTGIPWHRIIARHVLPNAIAPVVVLGTIGVGTAIVVGASLSFLGLGPQNGVPDWGRLLAGGEDYIGTGWWITTFPGLLITVVVIAVNILGDWMRDRLDVKST